MTRGRIDQDSIERILGKSQLPVLSPKSRLAELLMIASHEEDHRMDYRDTQYRSRRYAWICSSTDLAKKVVANCNSCKTRKAELQKQRISDLPPEMFHVPCQPYTFVVIDHAGPFHVSNPTRKRSTMKTWVLIIHCLNTGNVNALLCPDYTTDTFLKTLDYHANTFRWPKVIFCDRAANFLAGKKAIAKDDDLPVHDWSKVTASTAIKGVEWRVNPAQSQHRTGRAERAVASFKKTMGHMLDGATLCYTEFQLLLVKATRAINLRPLGIWMKNSAVAGYSPITPLKLIQGPEAGDDVEDFQFDLEEQGSLVKRMKTIEVIFAAWWKRWFLDCFTGLLPLPKWKERARNPQIHDICLLSYNKKYGAPAYRYCRVVNTFPDLNGLVRDVEVAVRPRRSDEPTLPYVSKPLTTLKVSIQRLVLLSPAEDQEPKIPALAEDVSETEVGLEVGNARSVDDVLARNQISLLEADERSNLLVSSIRIDLLPVDDPGLDLGHGDPSQQTGDPGEPGLQQSSDSLSRSGDSNSSLALTLSRLDDLPHSTTTTTLCPANLGGVLDHCHSGDVVVWGDLNVGDSDIVIRMPPEDVEVEPTTSARD